MKLAEMLHHIKLMVDEGVWEVDAEGVCGGINWVNGGNVDPVKNWPRSWTHPRYELMKKKRLDGTMMELRLDWGEDVDY